MNIFAALKYPFSGYRWKNKLGRGAMLLVIPIIGQIVWIGYGIEIIQKVASGEEHELPEWSIGDNFLKGLLAFIVLIIYAIPSILTRPGYLVPDDSNWLVINSIISAICFTFFLVAVVRYAVTETITSFINLPASLSLLSKHFFSIIYVVTLISIGSYLGWVVLFVLLFGVVTVCLGFVYQAYYFMVVGFLLGRLALKFNIESSEESVWMPEFNQPKTDARNVSFATNLQNATVYEIQLPKNTKFEPERAHSLIQQVLTQVQDITFAIVADHTKITWQIWDLRQGYYPNLIPQAVRDFFPQAHITVSPFEIPEFISPFLRVTMLYQQAYDFVAPIKYVTDLTRLDPLTSLVQGMSELQAGERIIHLIHVASVISEKASRKAYEKITRSTANPFLDISSAVGFGESLGELTGSLIRGDRVGKYDPQYQRVYEERLTNHLLFNCYVMTQVDMLTEERLSRSGSFHSNMLQFHAENAIGYSELTDQDIFIQTPQQRRVGSAVNLLGAWMAGKDARYKRAKAVLSTWEIASLWHLPNEDFTAPEITWLSSAVPSKELLDNRHGVLIGDSEIVGEKHPIRIHPTDRETHMNIIGKTGVGKSTFLHNQIHHDIQNGKGVGVLDPHGKLVRDILRLSIPPERENDVVVIDLADESHPPPLNPLIGIGNVGEVVSILETVEGGLPPVVADSLIAAFVTIQKEETPTVRDIVKLFSDTEYRYRFINQVEDIVTQEFWEQFENLSPARQEDRRSPVLHRMRRFYRNPILHPIFCHPQPLNFQQLIADKKIVLMSLGIDETKVPDVENRLVGVTLVKQFQMAAMSSLEDREEFFLYIDEVQKFVTAPLDIIFEQARKYGLRLTVANQYLGQLGNILESVMGNIGTTVVFQIGLPDARKIAPYFEPEFERDELVKMDKFHAAIKTRYLGNTTPAFKIATRPEPKGLYDFDLDSSAAIEREQMLRAHSITHNQFLTRDEIMAWLSERYPMRTFTTPNREDDEDIDWRVAGDE